MGSAATCRKPGKTVYILGAGFSRPAGIPVLSRFIPEAFTILKRPENKGLLGKFVQLVRRYQTAALQMGLDTDNLETLFCLSDLSDPFRSRQRRETRGDLVRVIVRTICASCKCHYCDEASRKRGGTADKKGTSPPGELPDEHMRECCVPPRCLAPGETIDAKHHSHVEYGVCLYKAFLSHIFHAQGTHTNRKKGIKVNDLHTIVSFNYDLVLEIAMKGAKDCQVYYGQDIVEDRPLTPGDPSVLLNASGPLSHRTLHYLKMHGSLNWLLESSFNYSQVTIRPISNRKEEEFAERVPLVPPTWKRGVRDDDIYSKLVSEAILHLRMADRIVIIGYSIPDTDTYFRYVLATALDTPEFPRIEVWDIKSKELMIPCLSSIFGPENVESGKVCYGETGLEGFVMQETAKLSASENNR